MHEFLGNPADGDRLIDGCVRRIGDKRAVLYESEPEAKRSDGNLFRSVSGADALNRILFRKSL